MNGLRHFADLMLEAIDNERRLAAIEEAADSYAAACLEIRKTCLDARQLDGQPLAAATEGLNAVRIIMGANA